MTKSFRLILTRELWEEWVRFFGDVGVRQAMLRRVVATMVHRAKMHRGEDVQRPLWMPKHYETSSLDDIVREMVDTRQKVEGGK